MLSMRFFDKSDRIRTAKQKDTSAFNCSIFEFLYYVGHINRQVCTVS